MSQNKLVVNLSLSPHTVQVLDALARKYTGGNRSAMAEDLVIGSAIQMLTQKLEGEERRPASQPPVRRRSGATMAAVNYPHPDTLPREEEPEEGGNPDRSPESGPEQPTRSATPIARQQARQ